MDFELDYVQMLFFDAEDLAEGGIGNAYKSLLPKLQQYVTHPAMIEEDMDDAASRYIVRCGKNEFVIYSPEYNDTGGESWGRATFAFFTIVNDQLADSVYQLFAINGGNDLGGLFLTPAEAQASKKMLPQRTDWPYLPTNEHPWYGQYH